MKCLLSTFLLLLVMTGHTRAQGQDMESPTGVVSVQLDRQSSGSGHMNFTALGASYSRGRSSIYAGAIMDDRSHHFQGMKMTYRFFPIAFGAKIFPYFQYDLLGRWNSRLTPELERIVHSEGWKGERHERYRTLEHYLGFGLQAPLVADLYLDLGIGMGFYQSELASDFDDRIEYPTRFRETRDASLSLRGSIGYAF